MNDRDDRDYRDYRVTFDVFGPYTYGKLAGKTNPKSVVSMVIYGDSVKTAVGKLKSQIDGCIYKITNVSRVGE